MCSHQIDVTKRAKSRFIVSVLVLIVAESAVNVSSSAD
jgi:hypothetical protein